MALLVIRLRAEYIQGEWDRSVHLASTSGDEVPSTLVSVCNQMFESYEIELLPAISGFPCDVCLHHAPIETASLQPEDEWKPSPYPRTPQPVLAVGGQPAVGFNNPQIVHRIPEKPLAKLFDGRTVVVAECGLLAYPVADQPGSDAQHCVKCDEF